MISTTTMNDEKVDPKVKTRIIEIDRKIAAQMADVWVDMKYRIQTEIQSQIDKKKEKTTSKLQKEIKET
jgi:hypothetical protein